MTEKFRGGGDRPGRGLGQRIEARRLTAGANLADGGVAVGAPLNRQWGGVRGAGMEGLPLTALRHQAT